jgi:hypothetical protein
MHFTFTFDMYCTWLYFVQEYNEMKTKLFACFQVVAAEFSHTVLHRQPFAVPAQKAAPGRPVKPAAGKYSVYMMSLLQA